MYGEMIYPYKIVVANLKATDKLRDRSVEGRTMLTWIFRKQSLKVWSIFNWLGIGPSGGLL